MRGCLGKSRRAASRRHARPEPWACETLSGGFAAGQGMWEARARALGSAWRQRRPASTPPSRGACPPSRPQVYPGGGARGPQLHAAHERHRLAHAADGGCRAGGRGRCQRCRACQPLQLLAVPAHTAAGAAHRSWLHTAVLACRALQRSVLFIRCTLSCRLRTPRGDGTHHAQHDFHSCRAHQPPCWTRGRRCLAYGCWTSGRCSSAAARTTE